MARYRKLPVEIEAERWMGLEKSVNPLVMPLHMAGPMPGFEALDFKKCEVCGAPSIEHGWIQTLESGHRVCPGDWIITGVAGEHYPCKPEIFAKTYEVVREGGSDATV